MISTVNSNTNRVSGLASGLDTEELVTQLTSATQAKIDTAEKQKTLLEWKQDAYREILNKIYDFNNKYFGSASGGITIGEELNSLTASSSSGYVSAVAGENADAGSVYIQDIVSLATAAKVTGSSTVSQPLTLSVNTGGLSELPGKSLGVTLDGVSKTVTFGAGTYETAADVQSALQDLLDDSFGSGRISVTESGGTLTLNAESSTVSVGSAEGSDLSGILDFTDGASNRLSTSSTLAALSFASSEDETVEFSINGVSFSFTGATRLSTLISAVNSSNAGVKLTYSDVTDKFTLASSETGAGSSVAWSDSSGSFLSSILGSGVSTSGTDAVVKMSLDGSTDGSNLVTVSRSTNNFTVNGVTYTLNGMASGTAEESITVGVARDADEIYDKITGFVSDYNDLIDALHDKLTEKKYTDYLPLLDDEEEDMSDEEIEKWTTYAKSGLLRNDSALTSIYNSLRNSLYKSVSTLDGSGTVGILTDAGISTGSYTDYGKLTVDEDALKSAIASDPDKVLSLFTQSSSVSYSMYNTGENKTVRFNESGLMWRISDIVKNNLSYIGKKGTLVALVGSPDQDYSGTNTYSKKIGDAEDDIDSLEDKLSDEQDYYWTKFTAMETALSSLNSTSSWLTSMLSSS